MSNVATLSSGRQGEPRHGVWPLAARDVIQLRPHETTMLRAVQGKLWVTFEHRRAGPAQAADDVILEPGERLRIPAGQLVVLSPFGRRGMGASFHWELPTRLQRRSAADWAQLLAAGWRPARPHPALRMPDLRTMGT